MKELLLHNTKTTFNAISVDGDTSTNDTVMLLANKTSNTYNKEAFKEVLVPLQDEVAKEYQVEDLLALIRKLRKNN